MNSTQNKKIEQVKETTMDSVNLLSEKHRQNAPMMCLRLVLLILYSISLIFTSHKYVL